jgi:muramidase (phage lysozyme)
MFNYQDKRITFAAILFLVLIIIYAMRRFNANKLAASLSSGGQREANLRAFLWMIRKCEGTANEMGYRTLFGYKYFDDFSKHPNRKVTAGGYTSTAAGAYQILYKTWVWLKTFNDLPDFSPENQDKAAVALIQYRGALEDVYAGRFDSAVKKCAKEWASLPGSPYGQPTRSLADARDFYTEAGGIITTATANV